MSLQVSASLNEDAPAVEASAQLPLPGSRAAQRAGGRQELLGEKETRSVCVGKFCLGCSQRETSLTNFCIRGENWGSISHRSSSSGWDTNCGSCGKTEQGSSDVHVSASGPSAPLPDCGQQVCPAYCCLCSQHNRNLLDIFGVKTLNTQTGGFLERLSLGQDRQSFVTSLLGELTSTPELHTCSYGGKAALVSLQHPPRQALGSLLLPCPFPPFC